MTHSRSLTVLMHEDGSISFGDRHFRSWVEAEREALIDMIFTQAFRWHCHCARKQADAKTEQIRANNAMIAHALRRSATSEQRALAEALQTMRVKRYDTRGKRELSEEEMMEILNDIEV